MKSKATESAESNLLCLGHVSIDWWQWERKVIWFLVSFVTILYRGICYKLGSYNGVALYSKTVRGDEQQLPNKNFII